MEILELGCIRVDKQPLIFPSLITAFCVRVRTGKKKSIQGVGKSRQANEIPEQTRVEQDYEDFIDYDQVPLPLQEASEEIPWKTQLTGLQNLRTDVIENRKQIANNRAEASGYFTDIWGNLTNMRKALSLPAYPKKKKRPPTFSPPSGGPMIDPDAAELQAVMELSRKEHEERMRAKLDPKGKRTSTKAEKESLGED
ncbi:hypothetical protein LWI29_033770 [Acer saccharum]|uniref:Uncharacterized protein n=1 Tax=Acer saccharum TaxID=4024 RepID=A0AA39RHL0_ACESA|nr:hypothetical protein LWI29_033770 [Acer saccharum]